MAGALAKLFVVLGADTSKFQKEMKKTEKDLDKATKKIGNFGTMMTAAITVPLVAAGAGLLKLGMDAIESENLFEVSMGGMADSARAWSEQLRKDLGLNAYEVRKNTGMFYTMFESMKLTSKDAYTLSTGLTQLSYDMASFYNLNPTQAFEKLQAGITGETEPLKRLGILVDETTTKTYAYTHGIAKQGEELSEQQKVMARYGSIMEQTSKAQGDLARTLDSPTNQLRIMREKAVQLGTDLGMALVPALKEIINLSQPLVRNVESIVKWFTGLDAAGKKNVLGFVAMLAAAGPLALVLAGVTGVIGKLVGGIGGIVTVIQRAIKAKNMLSAGTVSLGGALRVLAGGPVGLIILAIGALVAAGVVLYKNWDTIKYYGLQSWAVLKAGLLNSIRLILIGMEKFLGWIPNIGDKIRNSISGLELKIAEEKEIFNIRSAVYAVSDLADETDRYAEAQKRLAGADAAAGGTPYDPSQMGKYAPAGGDKDNAKNATKWIGTSDALINALSILRTKHEAAAIAAEMQGDKLAALSLKGLQLNEQMAKQKEIVAKVKDEILANAAAGVLKDETDQDLAKRTDELNKKLADEEKALVDLEKQIYDTNQAVKTQAKELSELGEEVTKVEKKYKDDLASALKDYQKQVKETNAKLADDERKLTDEYEKSLDSRAKSLRDFVGLFDAVTSKSVSGSQLLENLKGQVKTFEDWSVNIQALAAKGVDGGLIDELRQMGPKAAPEIAALNTLTDSELQEYVSLWQTKNQEARAEAVNQLQQQRVEMQTKLMEIRAAAAEQLELYRVDWEKKNADIRKNADEEMTRIQKRFEEISGAGTKYGVSLVSNFTAGMESRFETLRKTLENMANIVDSYMPHSPAKVGPLKRLAEWGPSLVKGLTEGIRSSMPNLSAVSYDLAAAIRTPAVNVAAPAVAMASPRGGSNTFNITVYGHNYEEIVSKLDRDLKRRGFKSIT